MSKFMYLFWSRGDALSQASPEEMQRLMQAWMKWLDSLRAAGHLAQTGERLERSGKRVQGKAKLVTDGPYAEAKDTIGGYLIVDAKDLEQAVELAKGCPVFELDGSVEVRPILKP
ncbi:MAG: YciI family protein [Myxococcota bacterium]